LVVPSAAEDHVRTWGPDKAFASVRAVDRPCDSGSGQQEADEHESGESSPHGVKVDVDTHSVFAQ
jgi:hypothetical protein